VKPENKLKSKDGMPKSGSFCRRLTWLFLDLVSAILDDPSCQKPTQDEADAMKAAVSIILKLEHNTYSLLQRTSKRKAPGKK